MLDTERYNARGRALFVRGMVVGLSFVVIVLGLLGALALRCGVWNTFVTVCGLEVCFYMFWRGRAASLNYMPPRHEPEEHDPAAEFEKFIAMIRDERIQV